MKVLALFFVLLQPLPVFSAVSESEKGQAEVPTLHDHYLHLQQMQKSLAGRSLEEQAKLQPQIQRAQQKACQRLRKDHQERIPREEYRRQGGDEFLVFSLELEQWCATAR